LAIPNLQIGLLVLNVHTTANLQNPVVYWFLLVPFQLSIWNLQGTVYAASIMYRGCR
jgi:hypothetical protein